MLNKLIACQKEDLHLSVPVAWNSAEKLSKLQFVDILSKALYKALIFNTAGVKVVWAGE